MIGKTYPVMSPASAQPQSGEDILHTPSPLGEGLLLISPLQNDFCHFLDLPRDLWNVEDDDLLMSRVLCSRDFVLLLVFVALWCIS